MLLRNPVELLPYMRSARNVESRLFDLLTPFVISLLLGNILAVSATGLTLTYSVMRFANFAHGELVTIGAYVSYFTFYLLPNSSFYVDLPFVFLAGACAAIVLHLVMFRPLTARKAGDVALLVGSIGVSITYKYILYLLSDPQGMWLFLPNQRLSIPASGGPQPSIVMYVSSAPITDFFVISAVAAVGMTLFLTCFLRFTKIGLYARSLADNPDLAQSIGVRTEQTRIVVWALVGGFTGIGGALLAPSYFFGGLTPEIGFYALFYIFAATILAGRTDFYATLMAAYIVAFASNYGILFASAYFGIPTGLQPVIPFAIIVMTLLLRPRGLSGLNLFRRK
jgi:branched-subunit amino acid ABC-type transport system permease component